MCIYVINTRSSMMKGNIDGVDVELKSIVNAARLDRPFPSLRITSPINRTRNLWRTKLLRTSAMDGMSSISDVGNILFYPLSPVCTGTVTPPCLRLYYFHASELSEGVREACTM